jgi:hypothetical protein
MINNNSLADIHKEIIAFFIKNTKSLIDQLNVTESDLIRQINSANTSTECTPYYCIIKFYYDGVSLDAYDKTIDMQVINRNKPPIVFSMHLNHDVLYEFEYFVADSSIICEAELFVGDIVIQVH